MGIDMDGKRVIGCALASVALLSTARAHAHITLLEPASWLNEDELGAPQKGSPCGPGDSRPFIGDDVQPLPASDAVTTYRAGETIAVRWEETIYHPGYFRIALARTRAADATSADFPDPPLTDPVGCYYDRAAVQTAPHGDVLADGLFMAEAISADNRTLMQEVTLPDEPCEACTLQVVQVMEGHGGESCFYFHCADIEILPAAGGTPGTSGTGAAGTADGPPSGKQDDGAGCSVAPANAFSSPATAALLLTLTFVLRRNRR
jgi:hypothetical protein